MYIPETSSFEMAPEGQHVCVCTGVVDLGTQQGEYDGQRTFRRQVFIEWETADETGSNGERFRFGNFYTLSSSEKSNFRRDLESWRGKPFKDSDFGPDGFKVENLLGAPALISVAYVEKNGKTRLEVMSIAPLPKGLAKPKTTKRLYFSLGDDFDEAAIDGVSEGLKKKILKSPEWADRSGSGRAVSNRGGREPALVDDEIPF